MTHGCYIIELPFDWCLVPLARPLTVEPCVRLVLPLVVVITVLASSCGILTGCVIVGVAAKVIGKRE